MTSRIETKDETKEPAATAGAATPRGGATTTAKAMQARRRELHDLPTPKLIRLYASKSGKLVFEVKNMVRGLSDEGRQIMIDSLIQREFRG